MTPTLPGAPEGAPPDARVHALDHLRALAMLAGVLFHAALAYSPLVQPYWPTADRQNWWGVDALVWLPHLVRMPLFFVVAGFFTAWLLARRGMAGLMRHRVRRILVPLAVALPLLHVAVLAATRWAAGAVDHRSAFLEMIRAWMAMPDPPPAPPGTGPLWFLYYLLLFSVLAWAWRTLEFDVRLERLLGARALVFGLPLALVPWFACVPAPHPAPESLVPQFWAIGLFGPFFALGFALHGRLDRLLPFARWLLPGALVCAAAYAVLMLCIAGGDAALHTAASWPVALLEACIAAWGTLVCLVAGLRWLARPNQVLRYLAATAYWVYLLHLPLLFAVQYALLDADIGWTWKLAVSVGLTLAACLASYELLVRRTPLRRYVG